MPDASNYSSGTLTVISDEKRHFKRRLRRIGWTVLIVVITAHVLVGVGAGFLVIARYFTKPAAQFVAQKRVEMTPEQRKHLPEMEKLESMRPRPTINNRIQSLKPTALALPDLPKVAVDVAVPINANEVVNDQVNDLGNASQGAGMGTGSTNFFGFSGKIKKLGVMLDISGSTHPFLLKPFHEIDRNFAGMPTVLITGCGSLEKIDAKSFVIKSAPSMDREYQKLTVEEYRQVAGARKKSKELDSYMEHLLKRPNVYWELNVHDDITERIYGAQFALSFLADQGVDTIYWFADFMDKFDEQVAKRVASQLNRKGIRVIIHDFAAKDEASADKISPGIQAAKIIARRTGGTVIYGLKEKE